MRHIVSNVLELAGAALVIAGIWAAVGVAATLIATGTVTIVYAWRLDR